MREIARQVADKTEYALHHGLKAIVCIGETLEQRESGELWNVLDSQLKVRGSSCKAVIHCEVIASKAAAQLAAKR
jgi:triosephosphate isomerase